MRGCDGRVEALRGWDVWGRSSGGLCFGVRSYTRRDLIILRSPLVQIPRPCNPDLAQDLFSSFSCFAERHSKRFVFINRVTSPVCLKWRHGRHLEMWPQSVDAIYVKYIPAKFHPDPVLRRRNLRLFLQRSPQQEEEKQYEQWYEIISCSRKNETAYTRAYSVNSS